MTRQSGRSQQREPIVIERELSAPPEDVYAAFGDAESLSVWMCPSDVTHSPAEVDFRVGGIFRIRMQGAEQVFSHRGEYLELDPPKRLVFTWVSEWMPEDEQATRVSIELEPRGEDRTFIRLVHDELPAGDGYDGHTEGWRSILEKLDHELAR